MNYEDDVTRKFGERVKAQVIYFSSRRRLEKGIYLEDGNIIYCRENPEKVCHVDELKLLGMHNYENVMAAVAMAAAYHVPMEIIRKTIGNLRQWNIGSSLWQKERGWHITTTPKAQIRMPRSKESRQ